jgi:hypothetical protein
MARTIRYESGDEALREIETRVEELAPHCPTIRVRTVMAMQPRQPWIHQLTMIMPSIGPNGPGRTGNRQYPAGVNLLEDFIAPREFVPYLKALRDGRATVGGDVLNRSGDGEFRESQDLPGKNIYSEYPGRLYWTSPQMNGKPNITHLIAPGHPYYADLSHAITDWTGVPIEIGTVDGLLGSVLLYMPEPRSRIITLLRDEDEIDVTLEVLDDAVRDLRLIGGWQDDGKWKGFEHLVIRDGNQLRLPVARTADQLNMHLVGGDGRWYDYHLEGKNWHIGQERVLGYFQGSPVDADDLTDAMRQGEGERIEFKEYIAKGDKKELELVNTIVAFANTRGGTIYIGIDDVCDLAGESKTVFKALSDWEGDMDTRINGYIGRLRSWLPTKMNHCPSLDYRVIPINEHRILAITVEEGTDRIYMRSDGNRTLVRRGASCIQADADNDIPRLFRERLGREWRLGDPMNWG